MITDVSVRIRRLGTWRILVVAGAAFAVLAAALFATSLPFSIAEVTRLCGQSPPDVRFYTSGNGVGQFLTECGTSGRAAYRNLQVADLFYPAVSGLFLTVALAMVLARILGPRSPLMAVAGLPLAGSFFDYLENTAAWIALSAAPRPAGTAERLLGLASVAKQTATTGAWILLFLSLGYVLFRAVRMAVRDRVGPVPRRAEELGDGSAPGIGSSTSVAGGTGG